MLARTMNPCDVMVLCAGLGTRLRPLTLERAKPAVPLLNRPLVGYAMDRAVSIGATGVTINTHWLPESMEEAARGEAQRLGLGLRVSHEPEVLGTGGGLWQARARGLVARDRPLVVLNGDVLFPLDLARVVRTHVETGALATMVLQPMPPGATYTPLEFDAEGRIARIGRYGTSIGGAPHLFSGVHVLSPEALDLLPDGVSGVVETVYAPLLARGSRVQAVVDETRWLDLGDPPGYLDAHLTVLEGRSLVDAAAHVDQAATLTRTTVGASARIGAGAELVDCVVWDGAEVPAGSSLRRTIVTPRVQVVVS